MNSLVAAFAVCLALAASAAIGDSGSVTTELRLRIGQVSDGSPTEEWLDAARKFNDEGAVRALASVQRPFTEAESAWLRLIEGRLGAWEARTLELLQPFGDIEPPSEVGVLVGNLGASDAFVAAPRVIAFDLSRLEQIYGSAFEPANRDRIDRFFDHEYSHVLHRIWRSERGLQLETPLARALWECLTEGVGNYRSLSARWRRSDGGLSAHAESVLDRLSPIFVERLRALESATEAEAIELTRGLSMGPFEQKWGALPVALWLTIETAADDDSLATWVERGPSGVLDLARKHLPPELAGQLPAEPRAD